MAYFLGLVTCGGMGDLWSVSGMDGFPFELRLGPKMEFMLSSHSLLEVIPWAESWALLGVCLLGDRVEMFILRSKIISWTVEIYSHTDLTSAFTMQGPQVRKVSKCRTGPSAKGTRTTMNHTSFDSVAVFSPSSSLWWTMARLFLIMPELLM